MRERERVHRRLQDPSARSIHPVFRTGTHPLLLEALEPHEQKMKATVAQADRIRQLQISNINAMLDCEKKQSEDESKARRHPRIMACSWQPSLASLNACCLSACLLSTGAA